MPPMEAAILISLGTDMNIWGPHAFHHRELSHLIIGVCCFPRVRRILSVLSPSLGTACGHTRQKSSEGQTCTCKTYSIYVIYSWNGRISNQDCNCVLMHLYSNKWLARLLRRLGLPGAAWWDKRKVKEDISLVVYSCYMSGNLCLSTLSNYFR